MPGGGVRAGWVWLVAAGILLSGCERDPGASPPEQDAVVEAAVGDELPARGFIAGRGASSGELVLLLEPAALESGAAPVSAAVAQLSEEGWILERGSAGKWWSWEGRRGRAVLVLGEAEAFLSSGEDEVAASALRGEIASGEGRLVVVRIEEARDGKVVEPGVDEHDH